MTDGGERLLAAAQQRAAHSLAPPNRTATQTRAHTHARDGSFDEARRGLQIATNPISDRRFRRLVAYVRTARREIRGRRIKA